MASMRGVDCITIISLYQDLQQILIQELYDLKLVGENEIDKIFNDIQRISELYVRAGDENIPNSGWLQQ